MFIYYFYILDYYNYFIKETGSYYALELSEFLLFSIYYILYLKGGEAQIGNILIFKPSLFGF